MSAQWLSLLTISFVIIASNVRTTYSECYITEEISQLRIKYPELKDCLNLKMINCSKDLDSSKLSRRDLLDISGEENGQEKLQLNYLQTRKLDDALLNTSIHNIWGKKLTIKIQNVTNQVSSSTCHTVDFNETRNLTMSLVSLVLVMHKMTIELFIEADGETKFRKYIFLPPNLDDYNDRVQLLPDRIFNYIDMSDSGRVRLYIHPLDESFNATAYNVTIKCAKEIIDNFTLSTDKLYYDWETSNGKHGECHFAIVPIVDTSKCAGIDSCITSSANFVLHPNNDKLIIMMVSFASIVFAVFIGLRWLYTYHIRRIWSRRERPNCLLVYSNTCKEHIEVMIKLAEYLRACGINAMIDELDAPKENVHNPYLWYHKAFQKATTVIIAASPPYTGDWPTPYRFLDKLVFGLMQENLRLKEKDYITIKFPYCKRREDIPLEARSFNSFKLPKDLNKLVERIQNIDYTKIYKVPKNEFLSSLKTAREIICNKRLETSVSCENEIGMEPFSDDNKSYNSKESIDIPDYSTDDDGAWLGKKEDKEEAEIVEDEENDDSVLWA